jgi:uncharacterized integral membrane protein
MAENKSEPSEEPLRTHRILRTGTSMAWMGAIFAAVVLAGLIVFIAQNSGQVHITFLAFHARFALGLALLIAALVGGVLVLVLGSLRMLQLRRVASHHSEEDQQRFAARRRRPRAARRGAKTPSS